LSEGEKITKEQIKGVIHQAENELLRCWEIIAVLREGRVENEVGKSPIDFQPKLARTIFHLTHWYRKLETEKKHRISTKQNYSEEWFAARMKFLSGQQDIVNRTIYIARGVGDAFAWFFYQNDRHYLNEHLAQQEQPHTPPGIGGQGELEFTLRTNNIGGQFVLYHGITSILRLGDVTLIDLKKHRVTCIGELKSMSNKPGRIQVEAIFPVPDANQPLTFPKTPEENPNKHDAQVVENLSAKGRERLERQLRQISSSYEKLIDSADDTSHAQVSSLIEKLANLVGKTKPNKFSVERISQSLLAVGFKKSRQSLYNKLSESKSPSLEAKAANIRSHVLELLISDRTDNSLVIEPLYYDRSGKTSHIPGMTHFAWWPIDSSVIKKILFQEILVFTIHNPAYIVTTLEKAGYVVKETTPLNFSVEKTDQNYHVEIGGVSHFAMMVQRYFLSEDFIVFSLKEAEHYAKTQQPAWPLRVELLINQRFGIKPE